MKKIQFVDAHLDQFGPQSGGWGSSEQLAGMEELAGAIRAFFCERNGVSPSSATVHLLEANTIRQVLMPPHMPSSWTVGSQFRYHVEGCESVRDEADIRPLLRTFTTWGVRGTNPIYHVGNVLGGCSKEPGRSLTELGRHFVDTVWERGWWLDVAHMSDASIAEVLAIAAAKKRAVPVCYTHGGIVHDEIVHPALLLGNQERCLTWPRAFEIVRSGGLVCLSPARPFYGRLDGPFLEHIRALGEASNWRGIGIGTDYGGILDEWRHPDCLSVGDCFRTVSTFLLDSGIQEGHVQNVMGHNAARFFNLHL